MRLYGRGQGFSSQARVTQGFRGVMSERGWLSGFRELDDPLQPDNAGATARTAVFTGQLKCMHVMQFNAKHENRIVMIAPNSTEIGRWLALGLKEHATHLLVPSLWARDVIRSHVELPIFILPHGVEPGFSEKGVDLIAKKQMLQEGLIALHLSSTELERKGTAELVSAWWSAYEDGSIPKGSKLWMILEQGSPYLRKAEELKEVGIQPLARAGIMGVGLSASSMAALYRGAHVVIQPSRGEGFGMVPLEARACGTPVVATLCTGHSEHMSRNTPGLVVIKHGELTPIDDMPNALAPEVTVESVKEALVKSYDDWERLAEDALDEAPKVREFWSWKSSLQDLGRIRAMLENE